MFRPLFWPSSGRCITKYGHTEITKFHEQMRRCKIITLKIRGLKCVLKCKVEIIFITNSSVRRML